MMNKIALVGLALLLLVPAWLSLGCSNDRAEVTWRLTTNSEVDDVRTEAFEQFADLVKEKSDGRMEIKVFPGGELYTGSEVFDAVSTGEIEMGSSAATWYFGKMPKTATAMSYVWATDCWEEARIQKALVSGIESMENEAIDNDVLHILWIPGGYVEWAFSEPVEVMEDMDGMRIRSFGGIGGPIIDKFVGINGNVVTDMDLSEVNLAAQEGDIDGTGGGFESIVSLQIYEELPYVVLSRVLPDAYSTLVNRSAFEALPEDLREIVLEAADEVEVDVFTNYATYEAGMIQDLEDNPDVHLYELTEAERMRWLYDVIMPVLDGRLTLFVGDDVAAARAIADSIKSGG